MLTLFGGTITQPLGDAGQIVPAGRLYFYEAGLETPKTVFADSEGDVPLSNPVVLDGAGRATIFLNNDGAYDIEFFGPEIPGVPDGAPIWSLENVIAPATATSTVTVEGDLAVVASGFPVVDVLVGGSSVIGNPAEANGDQDLMNWTPLYIDNAGNRLAAFAASIGGALVVQFRYLLRVSDALINITPKVWYGATPTTATTPATISGQVACSATAADYTGANQVQTVTVTLPPSAQYYRCGFTIAGAPAPGFEVFARAVHDRYVS